MLAIKAHPFRNDMAAKRIVKKAKLIPEKKKKELFSTIRNMVSIFPKGNKACQRSYQRSCAAHIDANQKPAGILREAAE